MKDFFKFLLSPYDKPMVEGWRSKVRFTFSSLGVLFVLLLSLATLQMLYIHFIDNGSHVETWQSYNNRLNSIAKEFGPSFLIFYGCIIGPFFEEVAFRLPFSFKRNHVFIGVSVLGLLLAIFWANWYAIIVSTLLIGGILYFASKKVGQEQLDGIKQRYGILLLHAMALLFALLHIGNYGEFSIYHISSYFFSIGSILISAYVFYPACRSLNQRSRLGEVCDFVLFNKRSSDRNQK